MEAQGIEEERRIRPYTASSRFSKDVESLHKIGMTSENIIFFECSNNVCSEAGG
jgi:hypothetical protein